MCRWVRPTGWGDEAFEVYHDIGCLKADHPAPENYADFDIEKVVNINGLDFIDFEMAYIPDKKAWVVSLIEPDNGQEAEKLCSTGYP